MRGWPAVVVAGHVVHGGSLVGRPKITSAERDRRRERRQRHYRRPGLKTHTCFLPRCGSGAASPFEVTERFGLAFSTTECQVQVFLDPCTWGAPSGTPDGPPTPCSHHVCSTYLGSTSPVTESKVPPRGSLGASPRRPRGGGPLAGIGPRCKGALGSGMGTVWGEGQKGGTVRIWRRLASLCPSRGEAWLPCTCRAHR